MKKPLLSSEQTELITNQLAEMTLRYAICTAITVVIYAVAVLISKKNEK